MKREIIVRLKNVSKIYNIGSKKNGKLYALKKVNFEVKSGDRIGIMGNNGAGKTTLFKVISGITKPSFGKVEVKKKIVSLLSLEDGFKLDLTGRENILLNGLLVGMNTVEVKRKTEEIIEYSGLKDFIDESFYKYSAGMKFRLAFSIAIASCCDLMILDEVFMSGDFSFQQRVFRSLAEIQFEKKGMATIISSHIPEMIWAFSNSYFVMKNGGIEKLERAKVVDLIKSKQLVWNQLLNLTKIKKDNRFDV